MRERVDAVNERLDLVVSGEKAVDGDLSIDGASAKLGYGKKPCKYTELYADRDTLQASFTCFSSHPINYINYEKYKI